MNGLQLSREYFFDVAAPRIERDFPDLYSRLAAGLVGNGSECFGYDDEISRDHDWGVDYFIWVTQNDKAYIPALIEWKVRLFDEFPPAFAHTKSEYGAHIGVMTCDDFYLQLIGAARGPQTINEWIRVPEENFALAVNGEIFIDMTGEFTKTREYLLGYYPESIRKKKIASCCMALAQTGQYNFDRIAKRGDTVTLSSVISRFKDNAIALVFLFNKTFKPYYKWSYRKMTELPILGTQSGAILKRLSETNILDSSSLLDAHHCISELCKLFVMELKKQGLTTSDDWFLTTHGEEVRRGIEDALLRSLPAQHEI